MIKPKKETTTPSRSDVVEVFKSGKFSHYEFISGPFKGDKFGVCLKESNVEPLLATRVAKILPLLDE